MTNFCVMLEWIFLCQELHINQDAGVKKKKREEKQFRKALDPRNNVIKKVLFFSQAAVKPALWQPLEVNDSQEAELKLDVRSWGGANTCARTGRADTDDLQVFQREGLGCACELTGHTRQSCMAMGCLWKADWGPDHASDARLLAQQRLEDSV